MILFSLVIVVHNVEEETFVHNALMTFFSFKSDLIKVIPELGTSEVIVTFAFSPLCKPIPEKEISEAIVFWFELVSEFAIIIKKSAGSPALSYYQYLFSFTIN